MYSSTYKKNLYHVEQKSVRFIMIILFRIKTNNDKPSLVWFQVISKDCDVDTRGEKKLKHCVKYRKPTLLYLHPSFKLDGTPT